MMGKSVCDKYAPDIVGEVVRVEYDAVTIKLAKSHRRASIITVEGHVADEARLKGELLSLRTTSVREVA